MKKTITKAIMLALVFAMAVCAAFAFAACGGDPSTNDPEKQDPPVKHEGYWTDKAEYAQNETMTVHFDEDNVFSVSFSSKDMNPYTLTNNQSLICVELTITNFLQESMDSTAVMSYAYFTDGLNTFINEFPYDGVTCSKDIPQNDTTTYGNSNANFDFTRNIKFVICIPGTQVPLASFTNIRVYNGNYT